VEDPTPLPAGSPERKRAEKWWSSRKILSESSLPQQIIMVTTHPDVQYLEELHRVYHGKRLLIFHNILLPFDGRYWFHPYPVVSQEHLKYTWCWGIWCVGDRELWRVHLLTFAEVVWNPGKYLSLESAFAQLYGADVAPDLVKYAELTYGSLTPRGVIADCRYQPPDYPQLFLDTGWFGTSRGKNFTTYTATDENIGYFTEIARKASSAMELIDRIGKKLPPTTAEKLRLNAERLRLDFEIQSAVLKFKAGRLSRDELAESLKEAKRLKEVIDRMKALGARGEGSPGDYKFEQTVAALIGR